MGSDPSEDRACGSHRYRAAMVPLAADLVLMAPEYAGTARDLTRGRAHGALGAAILAELALAGTVRLQPGERGRPAQVAVVADPDGLDPLLGERVVRIAPAAPMTDRTLALLAWQLPGQLATSLAELGLVAPPVVSDKRAPALVPLDTAYRAEVVDRLEKVILNGPFADPEPAALAGLLGVCDAITDVVRLPGMPAKEVRRRALMLSRARPGDEASAVLHAACTALFTGAFATE